MNEVNHGEPPDNAGTSSPEQPFFTPIPDVGIDITNRCNLSCRHCYNDSGTNPVQELDMDRILPLLDELRDFGQKYLQVSGGEPPRHPAFHQIVEAARKRGMLVSFNTNGVYDKTVRTRLEGLEFGRVAVSLDGMRDNNDRIRGQGTFESVLGSLPLLKSIAREVWVSVHVFRSNLADVAPAVELAHREGVNVKFSTLRPIGRARIHMGDEIPTAEDFLDVVRKVVKLRKAHPHMRIKTDFDILPMASKPIRPLPPEKTACPAGRSRLNVNFDGYVYPCSFLVTPDRRFAVGRLGDGSIAEMWRDSPVLQRLRTVRKCEACRRCAAYGSTCVGGCTAMAYYVTGRLDGRDPLCFADKL